MRRRIFGQDDLTTLAYSVAYAGVLDGLKRYTESRPFYERALRIYQERLGPVHGEAEQRVASALLGDCQPLHPHI